MLETVPSLKEIAPRAGVSALYVSRTGNLTLLAPGVVAAILKDALPGEFTLFEVAVDPPEFYDGQRKSLRCPYDWFRPLCGDWNRQAADVSMIAKLGASELARKSHVVSGFLTCVELSQRLRYRRENGSPREPIAHLTRASRRRPWRDWIRPTRPYTRSTA